MTWIRAPWGMIWTGEGFIGEPELLTWEEAVGLFGSRRSVGYLSSELTGENLQNTRKSRAGYTRGKCRVRFAGRDDWRLPTAFELDPIGLYMEGRNHSADIDWSFLSDASIKSRRALFPEWMGKPVLLWSSSGIGGDTAYGYDGRFPLGDQSNANRFGVILVRGES